MDWRKWLRSGASGAEEQLNGGDGSNKVDYQKGGDD